MITTSSLKITLCMFTVLSFLFLKSDSTFALIHGKPGVSTEKCARFYSEHNAWCNSKDFEELVKNPKIATTKEQCLWDAKRILVNCCVDYSQVLSPKDVDENYPLCRIEVSKGVVSSLGQSLVDLGGLVTLIGATPLEAVIAVAGGEIVKEAVKDDVKTISTPNTYILRSAILEHLRGNAAEASLTFLQDRVNGVLNLESLGFNKLLFRNGRINGVYALDAFNEHAVVGVEMKDGKIAEIKLGGFSNPTAEIRTDESINFAIESSSDPADVLKQAIKEGTLQYQAISLWAKFKSVMVRAATGFANLVDKIKDILPVEKNNNVKDTIPIGVNIETGVVGSVACGENLFLIEVKEDSETRYCYPPGNDFFTPAGRERIDKICAQTDFKKLFSEELEKVGCPDECPIKIIAGYEPSRATGYCTPKVYPYSGSWLKCSSDTVFVCTSVPADQKQEVLPEQSKPAPELKPSIPNPQPAVEPTPSQIPPTPTPESEAEEANYALHIIDFAINEQQTCTDKNACRIGLQESEPGTYHFLEFIIDARGGIAADQYPLYIEVERNEGGWTNTATLKDIPMSCGQPSTDKKVCYKTSGSLNLQGAHPGTYTIILKNKSRGILTKKANSLEVIYK